MNDTARLNEFTRRLSARNLSALAQLALSRQFAVQTCGGTQLRLALGHIRTPKYDRRTTKGNDDAQTDVTRSGRHHDIWPTQTCPARMHCAAVEMLEQLASLLLEIGDFPFAEIKVDRQFVAGCADDRLKQSVCRRILELADSLGARTVAEGVETRADFVAARELGFDLIQGFFFAKPMEPQKFARRVLGKPITVPN
jgi:EAL domain-containing protein